MTMISTSLRPSLQLNAPFSLFLPPNHIGFPNGSLRFRKIWKHSMCLSLKTVNPVVGDGVLRINGKEALTGVPENVIVTPSVDTSAFLGAVSDEKSCRHVFKLGVLQGYRLLCLFRFKIFWMIPRMGKSGSDVPVETQMLLLEAREDSSVDEGSREVSYILFLPVLDGDFRSSLQGNSANEIEFCIESGDPDVVASRFLEAVFINYGDNPFNLMTESMNLSEGGTPARFLIIDDGWQDTANEFQKEGEPCVEGSQFGARLLSIKENNKFRRTSKGDADEGPSDLKDFVTSIKRTFGLKYVYMWHALMGYWGGLHPNAPGTKKYNPKLVYPVQSLGIQTNIRDISMDSMEKYGVGMIDPAKIFEFYDDLHRYLDSQNVDGVKVDVQSLMETLGMGFGGRVSLTRQFHEALENSISRNFRDNSIICCMAHNTDSVYSSKVSAVTRASDDYYPKNKMSQTLHIAAVAFNSIFLGEVMVPDWDMFYSLHDSAEFHAAARAVGGCGVYVSDKPGHHDFEVLKKLVLPDGSLLRAKYPGRPTRDCLFNDPVMDGKSLLKIWNLNTLTGVIGVFNCQGAGTWPCTTTVPKNQNNAHPEESCLTERVSPVDIEFLDKVAGKNWTGACAIFSFNGGSLSTLPKNRSFNVSLKVLECEIFTVSPIRSYNQTVQFAPIGLTEMYNSGGAVESMDFTGNSSNCQLNIKGKGPGPFGAYSSTKPAFCTVNSKEVEFEFDNRDCFLTVIVPQKTNFWEIAIHFKS
ncbi:probable galactinol--sucrose galactosyltransferase 2 isoform X1 [Magnolia sinica]|uniref:probable galactinol--sucrose galactosyltransferase 2 isoform X1 n=1 Tax=Magnolia sinica TaxID=86752 RepID=UPI002657F0C8|nr:probable galactinol--sucrose galactosyltransferase 2 isoform X1 [Magnolia sinica]